MARFAANDDVFRPRNQGGRNATVEAAINSIMWVRLSERTSSLFASDVPCGTTTTWKTMMKPMGTPGKEISDHKGKDGYLPHTQGRHQVHAETVEDCGDTTSQDIQVGRDHRDGEYG